jgi:hypothetical protein
MVAKVMFLPMVIFLTVATKVTTRTSSTAVTCVTKAHVVAMATKVTILSLLYLHLLAWLSVFLRLQRIPDSVGRCSQYND